MLKEPGTMYLNREEQQELLDRTRRMETRLINLLHHLGLNTNGKVPNKQPEGLREDFLD